MPIETSPQEQREDMRRRQELQAQLQEAVRRSAPESEIKRIQHHIEELNKKIENYSFHIKRPAP